MPIDPMVLAELEKTDPELVQRYRAKMAGSESALASAQQTQDMGNYANVAGRAVNDFANSQKQDIVLKNRMQDLGKAPSVMRADRPGYDESVINNVTGQGVARAKDMYARDSDAFGQEQKLTDLSAARGDAQLARDKQAKSNDPASKESADAREYLKKIAPGSESIAGFGTLSEAQVQKISPGLFNAHNSEENRKSQAGYRKEMAAQTAAHRETAASTAAAAAAAKQDEKMEQLRVGDIGYAQTAQDAKDLKTAVETKASFDAKLNELIALRKDKGVEYFDREAVARGKQLSKELLLDYKNLAKLGVLSQSDEAIINAVIPSDPLGQDYMPGQDSTLHQLESWKGDIERDYQTKLNNRLRREGRNTSAENPTKPTVKMQDPSGKIYNVPAENVEAAKANKWVTI